MAKAELEHGIKGYQLFCRCDECKTARREYVRLNLEKNNKHLVETGNFLNPKVTHGSISAYKLHGCRCELCKDVNCKSNLTGKKRSAEHLLKTGEFISSKVKHGDVNAYEYHGCRCEVCKSAYKKAQQKYARKGKNGWFSVNDSLPPYGKPVQVFCGKSSYKHDGLKQTVATYHTAKEIEEMSEEIEGIYIKDQFVADTSLFDPQYCGRFFSEEVTHWTYLRKAPQMNEGE